MENRELEMIKKGYKKVIEIPCRNTGMGATTRIVGYVIFKGDIKIRRRNFSQTGRHWKEEAWISDDFNGYIFVEDISNSRKNYSYKVRIVDGQVVGKEPWDIELEKLPKETVYLPPP